MLSAHFWMGTGATVAAAAVMGLGLGSYVTSPQAPTRMASETMDVGMDEPVATDTSFETQTGPGAIHCTGCGPTLADRRWKADMVGLDADGMIDGRNDPVVRAYEAEEGADPSPTLVRPLPPQIASLTMGEAPPSSATVMHAAQDAAPPPALVATVADGAQP
ncbi:hypothetical protein U5A82_18965 [Sphingobium sp. CR2-8]|uniref:hypothetical protein n=1 Tax=Sphingobium sp. CR2-8 TaxID=1306534 RepID=UPI002DB670F0|nr:hypothetical protein [Sphingobium sp. CR2-8]MEC3912480.1 hypothetical protein [Sphingobium sp. CR2-8]